MPRLSLSFRSVRRHQRQSFAQAHYHRHSSLLQSHCCHNHFAKRMMPLVYRGYAFLARPFSTRAEPIIDRDAGAEVFKSAPPSRSSSLKTKPGTISSTSTSTVSGASGSSIIADEVSKFTAMSATWWDESGEARMLHKMNPVRIKFIRENVLGHYRASSPHTANNALTLPFAGLSFIDVGCGGGLLSEPLARLGAQVTGIDASLANIEIATAHKSHDTTINDALTYQHVTAEQLVSQGRQYDVVCALEIVEHVNSPELFIENVANLVKPGGLLFVSTINKNLLSYALAIFAAEHVLRLVPKGTHEYQRFVSPQSLKQWIRESRVLTKDNTGAIHQSETAIGMTVSDIAGMIFDPLRGQWQLDADRHEVNYILCAKRPS